jgi:hypothetical protein
MYPDSDVVIGFNLLVENINGTEVYIETVVQALF